MAKKCNCCCMLIPPWVSFVLYSWSTAGHTTHPGGSNQPEVTSLNDLVWYTSWDPTATLTHTHKHTHTNVCTVTTGNVEQMWYNPLFRGIYLLYKWRYVTLVPGTEMAFIWNCSCVLNHGPHVWTKVEHVLSKLSDGNTVSFPWLSKMNEKRSQQIIYSKTHHSTPGPSDNNNRVRLRFCF